MKLKASPDSLKKFLDEQGLSAQLQPETNQVYVLFKQLNQEFALFLRVYEGGEILQLLTFFPIQVPKDRFAPMARMLHLVNKEIDLPGFGMDEVIGVVFHRIMIPLFDNGHVDEAALLSYLEAVPTICQKFLPIIAGTATSELTFDEILKKSGNALFK